MMLTCYMVLQHIIYSHLKSNSFKQQIWTFYIKKKMLYGRNNQHNLSNNLHVYDELVFIPQPFNIAFFFMLTMWSFKV